MTTDHDTIRRWADEREHVDWDRWFETFEDRGLALLYQDTTADGDTSRFFKLVERTDT